MNRTEIIRIAIEIVSVIAAAILAYGAMSTRVAVIETRMENKVDKEVLFNRLDDMREKIELKIETEVKKIKEQEH